MPHSTRPTRPPLPLPQPFRLQSSTFLLEINRFSDLTHSEMKRAWDSEPPTLPVPRATTYVHPSEPLAPLSPAYRQVWIGEQRESVRRHLTVISPHPTVICLHALPFTLAVGPVKSQAGCGSCWAFAATGAMESKHALETHKLLSLSEEQLVDCSHNRDNGCQATATPLL